MNCFLFYIVLKIISIIFIDFIIIIVIIEILSCRECISVVDEERELYTHCIIIAICIWLFLIVSMIFKCSDLASINFNISESRLIK